MTDCSNVGINDKMQRLIGNAQSTYQTAKQLLIQPGCGTILEDEGLD
jgi:hypothetical protein